MPSSTLFLNNITCLDHAILTPTGHIVGGSYHVSCLVTGEVVGNEAVVVDFSKIKKQIKGIIDDREVGYDHKLIIIDNFSKMDEYNISSGQVNIKTPNTQLCVPENALAPFIVSFSNTLEETFEKELSFFVTFKLRELHPDINIVADVSITKDMFITSDTKDIIRFNYSHGLKNSSSWGCQNIAHGHYSFIGLQSPKFMLQEKYSNLVSKINVKNKPNVFIMRENIIHESEESLTICYRTERGVFETTYLKDSYTLIVLETETTIENIVDWFCETYQSELKDSEVSRVYVSEGLAKGSMRNL